MICNLPIRKRGATPCVKCCGWIVILRYKRRLIEKGGSCYVCIPSRVRKALGWKKGDLLTLYKIPGSGFFMISENGVDGGPAAEEDFYES